MLQQTMTSNRVDIFESDTRVPVNDVNSNSIFNLSPYGSLERQLTTLKLSESSDSRILLVKNNRSIEKRELSVLNDKFAKYIEKLKLLELHNKRLLSIKQWIHSAMDSFSQKIQHFYDSEVSSVNTSSDFILQLLDKSRADVSNSKTSKDAGLALYKSSKNRYEEGRTMLRKLGDDVSSRKVDLLLLQRRFADTNEELNRCSVQKVEITQRIQMLQEHLDEEKLKAEIAKRNKDLLKSEIGLLCQTHQCEIDELLQTIFENWKNEKVQVLNDDLSRAIVKARDEYDTDLDSTRNQLLKKYEQILKISRQRALMPSQEMTLTQSIDKLKSVKRNLQGELDNSRATVSFLRIKQSDILKAIAEESEENSRSQKAHDDEVHNLDERIGNVEECIKNAMNMQISLTNEIEGYRELLEGNNTNPGLRSIVESL